MIDQTRAITVNMILPVTVSLSKQDQPPRHLHGTCSTFPVVQLVNGHPWQRKFRTKPKALVSASAWPLILAVILQATLDSGCASRPFLVSFPLCFTGGPGLPTDASTIRYWTAIATWVYSSKIGEMASTAMTGTEILRPF